MVLMNEAKKVWTTPKVVKSDIKTVTLAGALGSDDGESFSTVS